LKKNLKLIIGAVLSLGLLGVLFYGMDFGRLRDALEKTKLAYVGAVALLQIGFLLVRSVRWRYLMHPVKPRIPVGSLFSATMIGFMANNVLPARLGEFVRAYAIGRKEEVSTGSAFATIVVERLFDGLSVLFLLIVSLMFMPEHVAGKLGGTLRHAGEVSLGAYCVLIALIVLSLRHPSLPRRITAAVVKPVSGKLAERLCDLADRFVHGLSVVRSPGLMAKIIAITVVHWGLLPSTVYLLFRGMDIPLGVYSSVLVFTLICIGVALPSTPGYVGTFDYAAVLGLTMLGIDEPTALGFAIVAHAANYLPVTLLGLYYFMKENMSLKMLRKLQAVEET